MVFVRNQEALRRMLSAVLGEEVESLTVLNPQVPGSLSRTKAKGRGRCGDGPAF
jgi:hypothetical protein